MKAIAVWMLLMAASAPAQTPPVRGALDRLSKDLMALASLPGLPEGGVVVNPLQLGFKDHAALKTTVRIERPVLDIAMRRIAAHEAERLR